MRWLTVQNYPWKRPLSLWALGHPPPLFPGLTTGTASHIPNASDCRACCSIQISGDNDDDEHRLTLDPAFYVHHKLRKQRTVWSTYSAASLPPQHFTAVKKQNKFFLSNTIWFQHVSHPSSQGQAGRLVLALAIAVPLARHGASLGLAAHLALWAHARHLRGAWPHGARAGHLLAHLRAHGDLGPRVGAVALLAWLGTLQQRKETVTKCVQQRARSH